MTNMGVPEILQLLVIAGVVVLIVLLVNRLRK